MDFKNLESAFDEFAHMFDWIGDEANSNGYTQ
jgi:hypothetical protein